MAAMPSSLPPSTAGFFGPQENLMAAMPSSLPPSTAGFFGPQELWMIREWPTAAGLQILGCYTSRLERGSRVMVSAAPGLVTKGPSAMGAMPVKATSGISLGRPARGNSLRRGK